MCNLAENASFSCSSREARDFLKTVGFAHHRAVGGHFSWRPRTNPLFEESFANSAPCRHSPASCHSCHETPRKKPVIRQGLCNQARRWVWVSFYFRSHSRLRCLRLPLLRPRHSHSYARLSACAPVLGVAASMSSKPS